jgi:DNA-binding GntR family transcriptional regulator
MAEGTDWVPARRRRLSEEVVSRVREAILEGRLRPGQRIVETELAERLEVSKSPVREAMKELEREGLVVIHPHQGAFVRDVTAKDIREIRTIRAVLEGLAVDLAMERSDPAWLRSLDDQVARMRRATDKAQLNDLHRAFHESLVDGAASERLSEFLGSLRVQVRTLLAFVDLLYGDADAIADDHAHLMDVIRTGDRGAARSATETHVNDAGTRLEELWLAHQRAEGDGRP